MRIAVFARAVVPRPRAARCRHDIAQKDDQGSRRKQRNRPPVRPSRRARDLLSDRGIGGLMKRCCSSTDPGWAHALGRSSSEAWGRRSRFSPSISRGTASSILWRGLLSSAS